MKNWLKGYGKMERFSRTEKLIGKEKLEKLKNSSVFIFGAGAVGSFAAETLVRSGIGSITIIDFDTVHESNINRQLFALESTLGQLKVDVAARRLEDINPECRITAVNRFADADSIPELLTEPPDIVIDAIDSVGPKSELLAYCAEKDIMIISSMGAARRTDPLAVKSGDLFETSNCPLARQIRKLLRRRGIDSGITCIYSEEPPADRSFPATVKQETADGKNGKVLGSLPSVTGIFGLLIADTAVKILTGDY